MCPDLDLDIAVSHHHKYLSVFEYHVPKFVAEIIVAFFGVQDICVEVKIVALVQQPSPGHDLCLVKEGAGGFHDRAVTPQVAGDLVDVLVLAPGFLFSSAAVGAVAAFIVAVFFIGPSRELLIAVFAPVIIYVYDGCHLLLIISDISDT